MTSVSASSLLGMSRASTCGNYLRVEAVDGIDQCGDRLGDRVRQTDTE